MRKRVSSVVKYAPDDALPAKISEFSTNSSDDFDNFTTTEQPISFDATIVWERTATGYRIVDLRSDRTNTARELISSIFFQEEPTSTETLLSRDSTSLENYRPFLTKIVKEGHSLCALREGTGKLVGVAVGSIVLNTNENDIINEGDLSLVLAMRKRILANTEVKSKLDGIEKYFEICAIYVDPEHRGKGVGTALLRSCVGKTKFLNLPICVGAFNSDATQRIGSRLGFEKLAEIPYASHLPESQDKSLAGFGHGNYSFAYMAVRIITETETNLPTHNSPAPTNTSKKSRKR